jgi:hypothetical protein
VGKEAGGYVVARDRDLERRFPRLREARYVITSPAEVEYNCVAWAAGDDSRCWWPDRLGQYYWPEGAHRQGTLEAFTEAFGTLGFEKCPDSSLEQGWEKVAIYAKADGAPTHAARQLPDGTWTSKLGQLQDIQHPTLELVSCEDYGTPVLTLRRRRIGDVSQEGLVTSGERSR